MAHPHIERDKIVIRLPRRLIRLQQVGEHLKLLRTDCPFERKDKQPCQLVKFFQRTNVVF